MAELTAEAVTREAAEALLGPLAHRAGGERFTWDAAAKAELRDYNLLDLSI